MTVCTAKNWMAWNEGFNKKKNMCGGVKLSLSQGDPTSATAHHAQFLNKILQTQKHYCSPEDRSWSNFGSNRCKIVVRMKALSRKGLHHGGSDVIESTMKQ